MGRRREYSVSGYPSAVDYRKPGRMPCRTCRQRHLGCDEAKPVCGPCKKSNRGCEWPSDEPGRQFKDETETARRRAISGWRSRAKSDKEKERGRRESSSRARSRSNSVASSVEPSRSPNPRQQEFRRHSSIKQPSIPENLSSQKELAIYRFFYDNVASPSAAVTDRVHGYLYFLPEMYRNAEPDSHLTFSVVALALATFLKREPNAPNASALSVEAGQCYGRALELVQIAIKDSGENYKDETLVSSFILSLYELMRSDDPTGWRRHCHGIFALVKHRGAQQFQHPLGVELFRIVLLHTITTCLTWRQKPPQPFEEWAAIFNVAPSTTFEVVRQMYKTVELCAGAVALMHSPSSTSGLMHDEMMNKLQHQERQLRYLEQLLNQQNPFEEYEWPPSYICPELEFLREYPEGYPQQYHVYKDARRAGWTNILRATRLIINESILDLCTGAAASSTISNIHLPIDPQIDMHNAPKNIIHEIEAITNIHSTASSICASLPNQLMLTSSVYASDALESSSIATIQDAFSDSAACPRGFFIVWPLQTVEQTLSRIVARNGDPLSMRFDSGSQSRKHSTSIPPLSLQPIPQDLYASVSSPPLYSAPLQSAPLLSAASATASGSQAKRQRVQSSEPPDFPGYEQQPAVAVHGSTGPDSALVELARMLRWVRHVSSHLGTEGNVVG